MKTIPLTALQRRILTWLGVMAFYVFSLIVFLRLTFPYDTLKERLLVEFNRSQVDQRLEMDDLSGSWIFGVEAENVRLISTAQPADDAPPGASPVVLSVDSLEASFSPLSYLFGTLKVSFGAELGGGELSGSFRQEETDAQLELRYDEIDISGLTILSKGIGLPLGGTLTGQLEVHLPERKMQKAEGKMELSIIGLFVGDGKAKVRNTIALPKLAAGDLVIKADIVAGRMEITEFGANGRDFELTAEGKVRLREPFERSVADLNVAFKFKDAYTSKSDLTKSIFGSPDGKVPGLFDMDPQVRQAKGDDGLYRWRVSGLLASPAFRPGAKVTAASAAAQKDN